MLIYFNVGISLNSKNTDFSIGYAVIVSLIPLLVAPLIQASMYDKDREKILHLYQLVQRFSDSVLLH